MPLIKSFVWWVCSNIVYFNIYCCVRTVTYSFQRVGFLLQNGKLGKSGNLYSFICTTPCHMSLSYHQRWLHMPNVYFIQTDYFSHLPDFEVCIFDNRGSGFSGAPPGPYRYYISVFCCLRPLLIDLWQHVSLGQWCTKDRWSLRVAKVPFGGRLHGYALHYWK